MVFFPLTSRWVSGSFHQVLTLRNKYRQDKETILLVGDEKTDLEVSKSIWESVGYRIYLAGSGQVDVEPK